jgi:hypothetical protein
MTFVLCFIAICTAVAIFAPRAATSVLDAGEGSGELGLMVGLAHPRGAAAIVLVLILVTLVLLFVPGAPSGLWLAPVGLLLALGYRYWPRRSAPSRLAASRFPLGLAGLRGDCRAEWRAGAMNDLLLQQTGNPTQYEVIADGQIVGRIALFSALRNQSRPWVWTLDLAFYQGADPAHGFASTREAALQAFTRCWANRGSPVAD